MLVEVRCDKFISNGKVREPIRFHAGLNVVLGDDNGSNSIGKSTFLMILDFVFGGTDYIQKCVDVQENVKEHTICFAFDFGGADIDQSQITECSEIAGKGIKAVISGVTVLCGNSRLMADNSINCPEANGTVLYVAVDNKYAGLIEIADMPKEHSAEAVKMLKNHGVKVVMLTGDNKSAAAAAAEKLGITDYYAELLPENKSEITLKMKSELPDNEKVMFVGDGINDAPVIASADIGVAMGGTGADSAIETADCVLMKDDPMQLADAFAISKKTNRIVLQNIIFALGVKLIIQVLGVLGLANMWAAVFADVGVSIIAVTTHMLWHLYIEFIILVQLIQQSIDHKSVADFNVGYGSELVCIL